MKVVVVSDSHRWNGLNDIVASTNADYYLHAGDSGLPAELIDPFIAVRGNCDLYTYPLERIIDVGFAKIYLHHGHYYSRSQMILKAKAHDCQIIVTGHTHIPSLDEIDGIYILNPGSVVTPRGGHQKSYALIWMDQPNDYRFTFIQL